MDAVLLYMVRAETDNTAKDLHITAEHGQLHIFWDLFKKA